MQSDFAGDAPSAFFGAVKKLALSDPVGDDLPGAFRRVAPEPQMVAGQGLDGHAMTLARKPDARAALWVALLRLHSPVGVGVGLHHGQASVVVRELVQVGSCDLGGRCHVVVGDVRLRIARAVSSSTSIPARNSSTSNRDVAQSMPIRSPASRACATVKCGASLMREGYSKRPRSPSRHDGGPWLPGLGSSFRRPSSSVTNSRSRRAVAAEPARRSGARSGGPRRAGRGRRRSARQG